MNARLLAVLAATAALTAAVPAHATTRHVQAASYAVSLPVPYPMTTDVPNGNGCWQGPEGASKDTHAVTLPAKGVLVAKVAYSGDWDLYLFDAKGAILAAAETTETGNTGPAVEKLTYKKGTKGQHVTLVACNWMGLKDATVSYTYTY
jgi:hypothetical protein